jgi:hypothetical protein
MHGSRWRREETRPVGPARPHGRGASADPTAPPGGAAWRKGRDAGTMGSEAALVLCSVRRYSRRAARAPSELSTPWGLNTAHAEVRRDRPVTSGSRLGSPLGAPRGAPRASRPLARRASACPTSPLLSVDLTCLPARSCDRSRPPLAAWRRQAGASHRLLLPGRVRRRVASPSGALVRERRGARTRLRADRAQLQRQLTAPVSIPHPAGAPNLRLQPLPTALRLRSSSLGSRARRSNRVTANGLTQTGGAL